MKHEFTVRMNDKDYDLVRDIIDGYRKVNLIGHAGGKGIFNSYILVTENKTYTEIWFVCKSDNVRACRRVLKGLEKINMITVEKES